MDKRYTGLTGEIGCLTAAIKNALEGIGLVRPVVSITLASEIGSEHSKRSVSPVVQISASFWEEERIQELALQILREASRMG
jgi:hypothetical protein